MTRRLYYTDSYQRRFSARAVERLEGEDGRPAVILDQTCFYPTAGGQPHDTGWLNGVPVRDVWVRESDQAIVHVLDEPLAANEVAGEITWERRLDHMQQHTGQHILSQAFIQAAEAETVGFHLGVENLTIDLDLASLTAADVARAEQLANDVVWENRPVRAAMVSRAEAGRLPLRRVPAIDGDQLRVVEIDRFDLTACGGTHVARTGEVGPIKVLRADKRGQQWRIEFRCGRRAWDDYQVKHRIVSQLMAVFSTGQGDIEAAAGRLRQELQQAQRAIKKQQSELIEYQARELLAAAERAGAAQIVMYVTTGGDAGYLRMLARRLTAETGTIALLGLAGPSALLILARAADAPGKMDKLLPAALAVIGGKGGGNAVMAQGGGPSASPEQVRAALEQVEGLFIEAEAVTLET